MLYFFVQVLSTTLYPDLGCDTSLSFHGETSGGIMKAGCFLIAPCKGTQDSFGFWIPHCGFLNPGTKC